MIKKLHILYMAGLGLLLFATQTTQAQTILTAGDIAVIGINTDEAGPGQRWAFMTMVDIAPNTAVNFTDAGYDGSTNEFRINALSEGHMRWTTPGLVSKGTIIYGTNTTINGSTTNVTGQLGGTGQYFPTSGDQIIVYTGTLGTAVGATFVYALNTAQTTAYTGGDGTWITSGGAGISDGYSYIPPGLTSLTTAALTSNGSNTSEGTGTLGTANYGFDNMRYAGTTSGTKASLLAAISNPANWVGDNVNPYNISSAGGLWPSTFTVLPVTLTYFNAEEATAGAVKLSWGTAMEVNNDHFTLERSGDGLHYTLIGTVAGKGDNNQPVDYWFTDNAAEQGINYYRLTQFDRDGQSKILGTRRVDVREIALRVGPNPAIHFVDVAFTSGTWREIKLYNSADQLLQTISPASTVSRIKISLQNCRAGTYYLAFVSNNGQGKTVRRLVKRE